ncbi:2-oxo acid dehydrogenase subunit E2 [Kribbella sancticallisti]|uniref:2-oxo acid dehydrogenase subunit E2 n=1 Tax=Kribbella sancticallisti TaxID=460087 RepID=UPI0031D568A0
MRTLAKELRVDLDTVTGTGTAGRVRKQDVLAAATDSSHLSSPAVGTPESTPTTSLGGHSELVGRAEKLSPLRKTIAKRMVESLRTSAQVTQVVEVDVTKLSRLLESVRADFAVTAGVELTCFSLVAKATIDALGAHPSVNATIDTDKGEVTYADAEHLSIAVDTPRGLLNPVIKDAGDLSLAGLARKIADLTDRGRNNRIAPAELSGGTFTITNNGSAGGLFDTPILNHPQVAILGTGAVVKRPVVIDDPKLGETIAVRQMVYLSLTYDNRLVDSADAARFMTDLRQRLETGRLEA